MFRRVSLRACMLLLAVSLWPVIGCQIGMDASGPVCSLSTSTLDFGAIAVGGSAEASFVVENAGEGTLTGSVGVISSDYSITAGGGPFSLEPGQTRSVTVRFSPSSVGTRVCSVSMGTERCSRVQCTGYCSSGPVCDVAPTELDFGTVRVGSYSDRMFNIRNVGDGVLNGDVTEGYPHFSIVTGGGPFSLTMGQTRSVTARFEPTSSGLKTGTIVTGTHCATVACEGVGEPEPTCHLSTDELDFGEVSTGSHVDLVFEIENVGGGTLTGFVHETCSGFSVVSGAGEFSLDSGEVRGVTVRFEPATTGAIECTVQTEAASCSGVSCSGTAI